MRAKPNKRKKMPKVIITDRDLELFDALHKHGVMTRKQVQEYFDWDCVSDVNRRLRKLYDVGYIDRRFLPRKFGPTPAVYMIGNEGAKTLASEKRFKVATLNRRRYRFKNFSDNLLPHELLITDFACLLKSTMNRYPDCGLHKWESDEEIIERCNVIEGGADVELKPDAYGSYHLHKTLYNFFLEADLGTEPMSRIQKKVELYRSFKASGLYSDNFKRQAFRLFIVTNSGVRARNISKALPLVNDLKIYIANIEAIGIDPLFAPVWLMTGDTRAQALHAASELTPVGGLR
jgi:Replication-relaxation